MFQGVAPATAGPLLESQTADTKPPKRDKIKKTPKVKKGKVVDISAGDATTSSAPVGPTTTSTPVEVSWLPRLPDMRCIVLMFMLWLPNNLGCRRCNDCMAFAQNKGVQYIA